MQSICRFIFHKQPDFTPLPQSFSFLLSQVSHSRRNQLFYKELHIYQKIIPYFNRKNAYSPHKLHINTVRLSSFLCAYVEHINPLEKSECDTCDSKKSKLRLEGARVTHTYAHARKTRKDTNTHRQPLVHTLKPQNLTRTIKHFLPLSQETYGNRYSIPKKCLHQHFLTRYFSLYP